MQLLYKYDILCSKNFYLDLFSYPMTEYIIELNIAGFCHG